MTLVGTMSAEARLNVFRRSVGTIAVRLFLSEGTGDHGAGRAWAERVVALRDWVQRTFQKEENNRKSGRVRSVSHEVGGSLAKL